MLASARYRESGTFSVLGSDGNYRQVEIVQEWHDGGVSGMKTAYLDDGTRLNSPDGGKTFIHPGTGITFKRC